MVTDKNTKLFQKFIRVEFNITVQMSEVNMGQGRKRAGWVRLVEILRKYGGIYGQWHRMRTAAAAAAAVD